MKSVNNRQKKNVTPKKEYRVTRQRNERDVIRTKKISPKKKV